MLSQQQVGKNFYACCGRLWNVIKKDPPLFESNYLNIRRRDKKTNEISKIITKSIRQIIV